MTPIISPELLTRMPAYQAAIQIPTEMTEQAWRVLKPRLISQLPEATAKLEEFKKFALSQHEDPVALVTNKEWDESQADIRRRLAHYADHIIANDWQSGLTVEAHNAADFASQVLSKIRDLYAADLATHGTTSNSVASSPQTEGPVPQAPLVLDAMKWVYNMKIKTFAERHGKDIFLCNDCDTPRSLTFEGVIQHYASTHTNKFSDGNSGIVWRKAPWPLVPPFAPDPSNRRAAHLSRSGWSGAKGPAAYGPAADISGHRSFPVSHGFPPAFATSPLAPTPQRASTLLGSLGVHERTPYQGYMSSPSSFGYGPQLSTSPYSSANPYSRPVTQTPGSVLSYPTPAQGHGFSPPAAAGAPSPLFSLGGAVSPGTSGLRGLIPPFGSAATSPTQTPQANLFQTQRDELARIARDVHFNLSLLPKVPPSVVIYTVIHAAVFHFSSLFSNPPNLDLFTDCVMTHPLMGFIKDTHQLGCKACTLDPSDAQWAMRMYSFHELLAHFRSHHIERFHSIHGLQPGPSALAKRPDWMEDMIDLPNDSMIAGLKNAPEMTDWVMGHLMASFPHIFGSVGETQLASSPVASEMEYDPRHPEVVGPGSMSPARGARARNRVRKAHVSVFHFAPSQFFRISFIIHLFPCSQT